LPALHYAGQRSAMSGTRSTNDITAIRSGETMTGNYVLITDDKGNRKAFYNFYDLIKYLDSFKMSFLPDGFSYSIHEEE
jgi:hypothetical protein